MQALTMSFATRYIVVIADVYDRVGKNTVAPEAQLVILRGKILAGTEATRNATNINPVVGFMDMAVMVSLTRESMEDPWARDALGVENAALVVQTLKTEEADIWSLADANLSPAQVQELRGLIKSWRLAHPEQHYVSGVQLADYPEAKKAPPPGLRMPTSVFDMVRLDPFAGLDPAVRQVEESRVLAERMFYYLQNMPTLVSWQTDALYVRMITQPQVTQLLKDTSTFSNNTTDFTESTARFAAATTQIAQTVETFRTQLPEQQATLVKQVNETVATQRDAALQQASADIAVQRDAALKQASAEITVQRDGAIKQINDTLNAQQEVMAKNLQAIVDRSLDQFYHYVFYLVLLAAGALLGVLVLFRLVACVLPVGKARAPEGGSGGV
jgi:hypothetical protein